MSALPSSLWILKPPNNNNGRGVKVVHTFGQIPPEVADGKAGATCVQQYIKSPFLIHGCKVRFKSSFKCVNEHHVLVAV